jgi:hypothetical protein
LVLAASLSPAVGTCRPPPSPACYPCVHFTRPKSAKDKGRGRASQAVRDDGRAENSRPATDRLIGGRATIAVFALSLHREDLEGPPPALH